MAGPEKQRCEAALEYAARKHEGQFRKGGEPYITHPMAVAEYVREWGYGPEYQIAALFHDLLEDTDAAESEILELGGPEVLEAVRLLTKKKPCVMEQYVANIRDHPMARTVKAADRLHNLRCAVVTDENFKRKYIRETLEWYMDFSPEIPGAVEALARSMETPPPEYGLYLARRPQ